jgi:hypothetical protein
MSMPKTVRLKDHFRLTSMCLPVSKNKEPVRRPKSHLVCYTIGEKPFESQRGRSARPSLFSLS